MKRTRTAFAAGLLLSVAACALLPGCASYRLGSMLPPEIKTVYVPTFVNETSEPFIETDVTRATLEALQLDGSLRIARSAEEADSVLTVTLTGYDLNPLTYEKVRRTAANEYRMVLSARVVLVNSKTGKVLAENPLVQGENTFDIAGDFTTSKATGLPNAARDLGRRIAAAVVEAW